MEFVEKRQAFAAGFDEDDDNQNKHQRREEGVEAAFKRMLRQVILENVVEAGGRGRGEHEQRRQEGNERVAPFARVSQDIHGAEGKRQRR